MTKEALINAQTTVIAGLTDNLYLDQQGERLRLAGRYDGFLALNRCFLGEPSALPDNDHRYYQKEPLDAGIRTAGD
ncbi:MAG: hypothetical protein FWF71_00075 [Actinomycetia bacterium]|nr:hypothetical protein [Actinomycetes bacterium]